MTSKTIAVMNEADLVDGQMCVHIVIMAATGWVSDWAPIGRKLISTVVKSWLHVLETKLFPPVLIAPITEHRSQRVYSQQMDESFVLGTSHPTHR
jgi:hypothetical protein